MQQKHYNNIARKNDLKYGLQNNYITTKKLDLQKGPLSCLFITCKTKAFSYLIGANSKDPKRGHYTLTN